MTTLQAQFRAFLVRHANALAEGKASTPASVPASAPASAPDAAPASAHGAPSPLDVAKAWLTTHRLLVLHDHPNLLPALRDHLNVRRRFVLARNLLHIQVFRDVVRALAEPLPCSSPIPVAPLKGMSLTDTIYHHDISLRPMGDIDLLVPKDRIDEAIARLVPLGFHEPEPAYRLRGVLHHRKLLKPRQAVELHTWLGPSFIPYSTWDRVAPRPMIVHGVQAHRLPPPAELVHVLIHFFGHGPFTLLGWVDEILALGSALPRDDQRHSLPVLADRLGCRNPLAATVDLIRRAVGRDYLPHLRVEDLEPSPLRTRLHRWIFLDSDARIGFRDARTDSLGPLRSIPSRNKLIEEFHAALLADKLKDAVADLRRMAKCHLLARFPTRIRPPDGDERFPVE